MDIGEARSRWPDQPLIVVFFIALEQPLALPDGNTYRFLRDEPAEWLRWTDGQNFVGLRIHRAEETVDLSAAKDQLAFAIAGRITGNAPKPPTDNEDGSEIPSPKIQIPVTVVEAATVLIPADDGEVEHAVSDAFDRCLHELRRLMIAYVKVSNDARFRPITRQTTRMIVPYAFMNTDDSWAHMGMFSANTGTATLPFAPEELSSEQTEFLMVSLMRDTQGDPMGQFAERNRAAWRSYEIDGDYSTVVVLSYTACEVLLNGVLLLMAWEEGMPRDDTRGWFEGQQGFMSRILSQIPPRLGGNWGTQPADAPISRLKRLAGIRHQVVHYGYILGEREAKELLGTSKAIEDLVKQRLVERRKKYPRTALIVLGRPGLLRHGVPEKWIDEFMDKTGGEEPFWLKTHREWLDLQH